MLTQSILAFPFANHHLASKTHVLNHQAVMAVAEKEYTAEVALDLHKILSCAWDSGKGAYVALNPLDDELTSAVEIANADLLRSCRKYQQETDEISDAQASEMLRHRLVNCLLSEYRSFFGELGVSPHEIFRHYDLAVSRFGPRETIAKIRSFGVIYNTSEHRRIFVSNRYEGLKYLTLCFFPGLITGLYADIGALLQRIIINLLIVEPGINDYTITRIIVDALNKNGLEIRPTLIDAIQGHPEALYCALVNEYGLEGLGTILMTGGSDFFEKTTGIQRYACHYACGMKYFEQFGYHLNEKGE